MQGSDEILVRSDEDQILLMWICHCASVQLVTVSAKLFLQLCASGDV